MNNPIYGQCPKCGGSLIVGHKCPGWRTLDGNPVNVPFLSSLTIFVEVNVIDCPTCQERFGVYRYAGDGAGEHSYDLAAVFSSSFCPFCGNKLDYLPTAPAPLDEGW